MTAKKATARPKALKPSVKSLITQAAIENPRLDRRILANELIKQIESLDEIPPTEDTLIKYISDARGKYSEDKPWNTATLDAAPIRPEVIPALIALQINRRTFFSKPLTIREAKWFNRLYEFKNEITGTDVEMARNENLEPIFLSNIIAMWAQEYAYREMIDSLSGIKEPDYSDMDVYLQFLDYESWYHSAEKALFNKMATVANNENVTEKQLKDFHNKWMVPSVNAQIRVIETRFLNHSLGTLVSPEIYHRLIVLVGNKDAYYTDLEGVSYRGRLEFFRNLRQISKDNADMLNSLDTADLEKFISIQIKIIKDGETK